MFNTTFALYHPRFNAEGDTKNVNDYLGGQLVALKPVDVYRVTTDSKPIKTIPKGGQVGFIYSWIMKDGNLWWQLKDNTFVKHLPGLFDEKIALATSDKADLKTKQDALKKTQSEAGLGSDVLPDSIKQAGSDLLKGGTDLLSGIGNTIGNFGKNLNTIIILLLVVAVVFGIIYGYKALKST